MTPETAKSVLHVGDVSAVGGVLAKYQQKTGMRADVISEHGDIVGYSGFYGRDTTPFGLRAFHVMEGAIRGLPRHVRKPKRAEAPKTAAADDAAPWDLPPPIHPKSSKLLGTGLSVRLHARLILGMLGPYDAVHLHVHHHLAPCIRQKFPEKKIIIHYHGNDIRNTASSYRRIQQTHEAAADHVLVSTRDLLDCLDGAAAVEGDGGEWLPIPCDTEVFYPDAADGPPKPEKVLRIRNPVVSDAWADYTYEKLKLGLPYVVVNRTIPYAGVRDVLCAHTHYIDWTPTYRNGRHNHTSLGLQALACGLTVLGSDFKMHLGGLPPEHEPHTVVRRLNRLYGF